MEWFDKNKKLPPEGQLIIIHFKQGLKPSIGYTELKKKWFSKEYKLVWKDDSDDSLVEEYISHWALYEPPM